MTVTTIPAYFSFIDLLAESLLRQGISELSHSLVLLPNRRACRTLRQTLIEKAKGQSFILPRMMPVADLDAEDVALSPQWIDQEILPPISHLERQGILMQLIVKYGQVTGEKGYGQAVHAAQLARELARLIDQIHWEGLSFQQIHELVPEDYAQHWQVTLDFLKIMTEYWPQILKDRAASDPAAWRRDLILSYAKKWQEKPPNSPVIAAGSTGSIPCTAHMLDVVRQLPQGKVILPGLDQDLSAEEWDNLEITHPQYGMANLLKRFDIKRSEVLNELQLHLSPTSSLARSQLLTKAMQPSIVSNWSLQQEVAKRALDNLHIFELKNQSDEAGVIALLMREAIEVPEKTVALVTPDRSLVDRVKSELKRWNLNPDDTGGQSLAATLEGNFLLLLAEALIAPNSILELLKVLQHPMMKEGGFEEFVHHFDSIECRRNRTLDDIVNDSKTRPEVRQYLEKYYELCEPFLSYQKESEIELKDIISTHIHIAIQLSGKKIFKGEHKQDLLDFWHSLIESSNCFNRLSIQDYPALLRQLMLPVSVRQPHGYHPRLFILGPLEARTTKADMMILGGLNEGSWPPQTEADPWLNRPMRSDYGLPLPERRIGLSAHDFVQAFCAKEVVCTRATRINGTPSVPARWLQRVQTVLKASGQSIDTTPLPWLEWYQELDQPKAIKPCKRPAPCPPIDARPKKLSVTQVEMWMRDPYALYARKILKLNPLEEREYPLNVAMKGMLIHDILDNFVQSGHTSLEELLKMGQIIFQPYQHQPDVINFWWPRFQKIAEWFITTEEERRPFIAKSLTETTGQMELASEIGEFTLTAKADRIDLLQSGEVDIIDYKTGLLPSKNEVEKGFAPQLTLEAAIVRSGGFKELSCIKINSLLYWRLRGGVPAGEIRIIDKDLNHLIDEAIEGLKKLIQDYANIDTAYLAQPRTKFALRYNPYAHLARAQEWLREAA